MNKVWRKWSKAATGSSEYVSKCNITNPYLQGQGKFDSINNGVNVLLVRPVQQFMITSLCLHKFLSCCKFFNDLCRSES